MKMFDMGRCPFRFAAATLVAACALAFSACGNNADFNPYEPIFTPPVTKLAQTQNISFADELYAEAVAYEPLLATAGTQVNMGFWSAAGNHGSLVRLLDSINATSATASPPQRAIWDEGATSSLQYPAYVTMNEEHWYERATTLSGDLVTIYGVQYVDPYPVTFQQADDIWGGYSQRYADTAMQFKLMTGNVVKVWCYIEGYKANRVFATYELPELRTLEAQGVVQVFFALTQDADWQDPADWIEGTQNIPAPAAADASLPERLQAAAATGALPASARGIPLDDF